MSQPWNLLNYPTLHRQRRRRHRMRMALAGLAVGTLLAAATQLGLDQALQQLRGQHAQLQAQWQAVSQQRQREQQQLAAREAHRLQAQHLQHIAQQHQAWAALCEALLGQAPDAAWRLTRLQLESGRLELGGWGRDFEHLNATRQRLSAHLQAHGPPALSSSAAGVDLLRQTSVVARVAAGQASPADGMGLEFAWVSAWPVLSPPGSTAPKPGAGAKP